jgi:hypothetical protein
MNRRLQIRSLTIAGLSLIAAAASFAQSAPTAEQILDKYVAVTGGKAAHESIKAETVAGTIELPAQGIKGKLISYRNAKNSSYSVFEIEGVGKIEEGYHEGIAWQKSAMTGPRVKSGEEKAFAVRESAIAKDARWRDQYAKAELAGEETIDGVACYKIVMTPKDSERPETRFYEKSTGLLKRASMTMASQMGDLPAQTTFSEYKEFGPVKAPTIIRTMIGPQELLTTITAVDYTTEVPADRFTVPADVKALAAGGK